MAFDLKRVVKVMLFASNGPLSAKDIQTAVTRFHDQATALPLAETGAGSKEPSARPPPAETAPPMEVVEVTVPPVEDDEHYREVPSLVTAVQIREAIDAVSLELQAADSEIVLVEGHSGWRLVTHPRFARWVRLLRNEPPPVRLSPSSLETLAVVAYRQPVSRARISAVRGVNVDGVIRTLTSRGLVAEAGHDESSGAILYRTTELFLERLGLTTLDDLPPVADYLPDIELLDDFIEQTSS